MGEHSAAVPIEKEDALKTDIHVARVQLDPGRFWLAASPRGLCRVAFPNEEQASFRAWLERWCGDGEVHEGPQAFVGAAIEQLRSYFSGELKTFDLTLDLRATPFQRQVLHHVAAIPYGQTRSYGQLAAALGKPNASRAVGAANAANPLPLFIPCHRVVGSGGQLTGFGGGVALKRRLLRLEGHAVVQERLVDTGATLPLFERAAAPAKKPAHNEGVKAPC